MTFVVSSSTTKPVHLPNTSIALSQIHSVAGVMSSSFFPRSLTALTGMSWPSRPFFAKLIE